MELTVLVVAATPASRAGLSALLREEAIAVLTELPLSALLEGEVPIEAGGIVVDRTGEPDTIEDLIEAADGAALVVVGATASDIGGLPAAAGAVALLGGAASGPTIAAAVVATGQGLRVIDPAVGPGRELPLSELTPRELEVLQRLAQGVTNKRLALDLAISENTVKFHVSAVLAKLGAESRTEAVAIGARRGLVAL